MQLSERVSTSLKLLVLC
uniref:Uncharacterized protein n=1 Tax=Arundo donax TaxID=35708 RepID=A0A0A9BK38_ARUDO